MSENNSNQPQIQTQTNSKQYLLFTLVVLLVGIVGFQAWYMMSMKQHMEAIQSMVSAGDPALVANAAVTQTAQLTDNMQAVPSASASQAPSSPAAKAPSVAQNIQKSLNARAQVGQPQAGKQGQAIPVDPPSVFDNNFFNQPSTGQNWNPYAEIERMQRDMDRMFNNAFSRFNSDPDIQQLFKEGTSTPAMDVKEDNTKYTVIVNLPGADEKNIAVNLDGQQLTVRGEQDFSQQKKDAMGNVIFQERHSGTFQRSITLPEPVKQNGMVTKVDNGVLTITVPKVS
jgi:HSP20 family protein